MFYRPGKRKTCEDDSGGSSSKDSKADVKEEDEGREEKRIKTEDGDGSSTNKMEVDDDQNE